MNKILFIAPHPDDETLGCGGTIMKHRAMGDKVYWLIMTNISVKDGYAAGEVNKRQNEIEVVAKEYGFEHVFPLDFPAAKLDVMSKSQIIQTIKRVIDTVIPDVVYLPNGNDVHSDHAVTFDTAISSMKTFRCPSIKKIFIYEVISETEFSPALPCKAFVPNSFSDISNDLDRKVSIMQIYKGEMCEHPFPRSRVNIKALATFRGATAGVKYAEAFMVLKEIW